MKVFSLWALFRVVGLYICGLVLKVFLFVCLFLYGFGRLCSLMIYLWLLVLKFFLLMYCSLVYLLNGVCGVFVYVWMCVSCRLI